MKCSNNTDSIQKTNYDDLSEKVSETSSVGFICIVIMILLLAVATAYSLIKQKI